jgi:HAE1 family hydrophobic/amphiphilic exporter-1
VMVFVPIVFTQGIAAEIFRPLALTVTFSLLAALFVALTLVPMLAGRLLKEIDPGQEGRKLNILGRISDAFGRGIEGLNTLYGKVLKWAITHRKTIVFGTILLLVASFALVPLVGMEFIPSFDQGELMINVTTPTGTQLSETAETMGELEQVLLDIPGVDMVFTTVGGNPMSGIPGPSNANAGSLYVRLVPLAERTISTNQVIERMNEHGKNMAGVTIKASGVQSADTGTPISVDLAGPDLDVLRTLSTEIENIVASVPGTTNVSSSMDDTRPELRILVDRELAAQYGLSFNEVMQSVRAGFNGQVATRMKVDGQEINVNVILPEENRSDVSGLENMTITNASGVSVPLSTVASLKQVEGPSTINRQNQERGVNVTGEVLGRNLASVVQDIQAKLDGITLPEGYTLSFGGQNEEMLDAFSSLLLALGLAVFLVYAVMAVQFESAMQPFIIMFSLPATFIGIILGFVITGRPLSVPAFIGVIMLVGLVVNNAIVLIDYINVLRREGLTREEAILQAGPRRLRPILMTTLTTVLAMIPLVIGVGEGSEMQQPLATVIVFGLSFSTLITLVLVPVMYIYLDRLGSWWMGLFRRKKTKTTEEVANVEV